MTNYVAGTDFSGRDIFYGVGVEATRGTAVNPYYGLRWETADFEDKAMTQLNKSALGVLNQDSGAEITQQWGEGQLAGKVTDRAIGVLLYGLNGAYGNATHSGESIVKDHTFTASQLNSLKSLTVTRKDPNVTERWAEAIVGSMSFEAKAGDFVRHTTNFTSQPSSVGGSSVPYVDETEFVSRHISVVFSNQFSTLGTDASIPCTSFKLDVNNNVTPYWIIGQNNPYNVFAQSTVITGEIELLYDSNEFKNIRFNNTSQAVKVTIQNSDVTIGTSTHPTLTFTMPYCSVTDWKPNQSLDGMVSQQITFTCLYSLDFGYAISTVLTNLVSSYNSTPVS